MTAQQAEDFINFEIDQYGSPDLDDDEMSHFINTELGAFFEKHLPNYEKDEWTRRAFLPLRVQPSNVLFPGGVINTTAFDNFGVLVELSGLFTYNFKQQWFPIRALKDLTQTEAYNDPFASPTNNEPKYVTKNTNGVNYIYILSQTLPSQVKLAYVRQYMEVDIAAAPNAELDFDPFLTHKDICKAAVVNILKTYEDPRFSAQIYEEQYAKTTPKVI